MSFRRPWTLLIGATLALAACDDEPRRPLGASCNHDDECESGRCVEGICVAPHPGDADAFPDTDASDSGDPSETVNSASLVGYPQAHGNDALARFEFESDPPGASFECSLDGGSPMACSSPFVIETTEGRHTLVILVTWPDGSAKDTTLTYTWTVDLTPPVTTLVAVPADVDNSLEVVFRFETSEPAVSSCWLDEAAWQPCTSPHVVSGLADGPHLFEVASTDEAGNVEAEPARHRWTIDTSTPDTLIDRGPQALVAETSATFEFSSPSGGTSFECALDAADFAACASPFEVVELEDGEHTFAVRAYNGAGAVDPTPAEWTWVVDTVEPISGVCGAAAGGSTLTAPTRDLCEAGVPGAVSGTGPYNWSCQGSGRGTTASCTANRSCDATELAWSVGVSACGASMAVASHGTSTVAIDSGLPTTGSQSFDCDQGAWIAVGSGTCATAEDGVCGAAAGGSTTSAPDRELCLSGAASGATGDGPYTWTCSGSDGGVSASCSSNRSCTGTSLDWSAGDRVCGGTVETADHGQSDVATDATPPTRGTRTYDCDQGTWVASGAGTCVAAEDGACGAAAEGSTTSAPDDGLCASGTPSAMSGDGPFTWTCIGSEGGTDASCSSNRSCAGMSLSWSIDESPCSATVETTDHGERGVASDTGLPTTGARTYDCDQGAWIPAGAGTCVTAIGGACGAAAGGSTVSTPAAALCDSGTPSVVSGDGPYGWTCAGSDGGASASCSSNRSCAATSQDWTVGDSQCSASVGTTDHGESDVATDATLPTTGNQIFDCDQGMWTQPVSGTCVTAVDGACGSADGGSTTSAPTTGLCTSGTPSGVTGSGPFTWTCGGIDGGSSASCSSNKSCTTETVQWTVGDSTCSASVSTTAQGGSGTATDSTLPTTGSQSYACAQGTWSASGTGTCVTAVDGQCGSADGGSTTSAPTTNLCASGTPSTVSGSGPYTWSCSGSNGGSTDFCSSNRSCSNATQTWTVSNSTCSASVSTTAHGGSGTATDSTLPTTGSQSYACAQGTWSASGTGTCVTAVDGQCGSADGGSTTSAPTTNLCASGTPSTVSGSGPYTWSCSGSNGGSTDVCSSNRSCIGMTLSWTIGNATCSGSIPTMDHSYGRTVSDSTPPTTGSQPYTCNQGGWSQWGTGTCVVVVDGQCGSADGGSTTSAPTTNLCASGTPSTVSGSGPYTWSCAGENGGATDYCSSNRSCAGATQTWTVADSTCSASVSTTAHGGSRTATDSTPPTTGSQSYACAQGVWSGSGTGTCTVVEVAQCGSADGGSTTSAPTTNLCASGTPSTVSGSGPYTWSCTSTNGETTDYCSSNRSCLGTTFEWTQNNVNCSASVSTTVVHGGNLTATDATPPETGSQGYECDQGAWSPSGVGTCVAAAVDGKCGSAAGDSTTSAPTTNLCASGAQSTVSGNGPYTWSCSGENGGATAYCSSNRSCLGTSLSWSFGNYVCSGSVPETNHSYIRTVTDAIWPVVGSQDFTCRQGAWSKSGTGTCQHSGAD